MLGLLSLIVSFVLCFEGTRGGNYSVPSTCQPITIPLCKSLPYNMTRLPNLLFHYTQASVAASIDNNEIRTLVTTNCSDALVFVLCVYHLPICTTGFDTPIPPCRSLCQKVKNDCLPTLRRFGRKWPSDVNCNDMPTYEKGVCIKPESFMNPGQSAKSNAARSGPSGRNKKQCKCNRDNSTNLKKARGFDFVIIAQVNKIIKIANQRRIILTNRKTVREGLVKTTKRKLRVYTNSSCPCPALQINETYLLMGHEDVGVPKQGGRKSSVSRPVPKSRLILGPQSFVYDLATNSRKYKQIKKTLPSPLRNLLTKLEQEHKKHKRKMKKLKKNKLTKNKKKANKT